MNLDSRSDEELRDMLRDWALSTEEYAAVRQELETRGTEEES